MNTHRVDQESAIRDAIRHHIIETILFGDGDTLDDTVSFQESGTLDSVGFLAVITFIEERFAIRISDDELIPGNFDTVEKMSAFVHRRLVRANNGQGTALGR